MRKVFYTSEGDPVGEYEMKHKHCNCKVEDCQCPCHYNEYPDKCFCQKETI